MCVWFSDPSTVRYVASVLSGDTNQVDLKLQSGKQ